MRRRIELYINNQAVDMDEQSLILFTYTKENLDNPSLVRNSYSKQITLKGTARNNRVFEEMYRLDRTTGTGQLSVLERIPFSIIADGGVCLEKGYCKIDSIKRDGARCEYTITLYGQLGAFFYKLTTKDSGDALTLADLPFNGNVNKDTQVAITGEGLNTLWNQLEQYLTNGTRSLGSIVNFNPCYNGKPEEFDVGKVQVHGGDYFNTPTSVIEEGVTYVPKDETLKYIVTTGADCDLQDTNDYRAYLMRPMLSVYETMQAIARYMYIHFGNLLYFGTTIGDNIYYKRAWMTLANVPVADRSQGYTLLGTLLEGTPSPASFLIGFARLFGYSFAIGTDDAVRVIARNDFYNDTTPIDLTARVNTKKGHTLTPVFAEARWFDFALEGVGEVAKKHKELYNREYGSQRVDTSYQFGEATKNIFDGLPFKVCAETIESGVCKANRVTREILGNTRTYLPVQGSITGSALQMTAELYDSNGEAKQVNIASQQGEAYESADGYFTRPQMCDDDRKQTEGLGVLMFLRNTFVNTSRMPRWLNLHSYDADRIALNGGTDCWDMTTPTTRRSSYPNWSNTATGDASILPTGIYTRHWSNYITDRYDKDSRVWKCSVDFSGMQVGDALLRRFYYYGGAIWVLNKINNYSLTTYDAVECEFVKVKDITDYNNGQTL